MPVRTLVGFQLSVRKLLLTATFSDDADDDDLLNTNETALGTDPRNPDSDADGSDDPEEPFADTSSTNGTSVFSGADSLVQKLDFTAGEKPIYCVRDDAGNL